MQALNASRGIMASNTLAGRLILIAEDVAVIAMEIESTFKDAGARSRICSTVEDALVVAEDRDLAAAVVNHILRDGESSSLCERLKERGIPFVLFSGFANVSGACRTGVRVDKPTTSPILLSTVAGLLRSRLTLVPKPQTSQTL
jgi:DNA-binding response OmpR family regulator